MKIQIMDVKGQEAEYYFYHKSDWSVQTSGPLDPAELAEFCH